jgi:aryl-alcohol dehydrogenase-like predicted oxidoreductase
LIGPVVEQPQYNMLHRERVEREYQSLYDPNNVGMGTTIWSPLASGLLSGKYHSVEDFKTGGRFALAGFEWLQQFALGDTPEKKLALVAQLTDIAKSLGMSLAQLAITWCLRNQNVSTVILGASKRSQLEENLQSLEHQEKITDEISKTLERVLIGL